MRDLHPRERATRMGDGRLEAEMPCTISNINFRGSLNRFGVFSYGNVNVTVYNSDIGRFCSIAHDVLIGPSEHPTNWLSTHGFAFGDMGTLDFSPSYRSIVSAETFPPNDRRTTIGNDVWIGARAFIRRGITIGDGAIIGANATVVADVPPYQIVAGNPARLVRQRFDDDTVAQLMDLRWWDYYLSKTHLKGILYSDVADSISRIRDAVDAGLPKLRPPVVTFLAGKPQPSDPD